LGSYRRFAASVYIARSHCFAPVSFCLQEWGIYWVHYILHFAPLYQWLHKPHVSCYAEQSGTSTQMAGCGVAA
jgi:sterol desaturase/sphingolipid hydroxylase (fatty acid hydroxylase superfamily)